MPWWQWVADAAGLLLLLLLLYLVAVVIRRRVISRSGGTFELSHRVRSRHPGRGWVLGIGRYSGEQLEWFRIFSLWPRPRKVWHRGSLTYESRREPVGHEATSLYADHMIAVCQEGDQIVELAMSPSSLTGFQSWLEAGPPGASTP